MMAAVLSNAQTLDRAERSSRGRRFVALTPDLKLIDHLLETSAPAAAGTRGAVGAVVIRPPAFFVSIGEPAASQVIARLGADALGVRAPDGKSAFLAFRGAPPAVARKSARIFDHIVLPGMALPDGRTREAIGASLLDRPGDPRAEALPVLPQWLGQWIGGKGWPAEEPEPEATPEPAPSSATCASFDGPSGECRRGPPSMVVGSGGVVPGWLVTRPDDVCATFTPRTAPPPACRSCKQFEPMAGTDARRGLCRGSPPLQPIDNSGRPVGRSAVWPSVSPRSWCGEHVPVAES